jgi:uncharacterized membrane protein YfcA
VSFGWFALAVGWTVVLVGATVQGTIGFGINMLSAPVVALVAPDAVPASVVLVALPLCILSFVRERDAVDRAAIPWLVAGTLPGTAMGLVIVAAADPDELTLVIGLVTLLAVALSLSSAGVVLTPTTAFVAGTLANVFGTAAGTSGGPVALLYQHQRGPAVRSTLGAFFTSSAGTSIIGYLLVGKLGVEQLEYASLLAPAMLLGLALSTGLRAHADARVLRPVMLALVAVAGMSAVIGGLT